MLAIWHRETLLDFSALVVLYVALLMQTRSLVNAGAVTIPRSSPAPDTAGVSLVSS